MVLYTVPIGTCRLTRMLEDQDLEKFKQLYLEEFHIALSNEEATRMATDLINLVRVLLKPDQPEKNEEIKKEERRDNETISTNSY